MVAEAPMADNGKIDIKKWAKIITGGGDDEQMIHDQLNINLIKYLKLERKERTKNTNKQNQSISSILTMK